AAALSATALSLAFAMPAHAQDTAAEDNQGGIAEIVVTAQKVAENVQDVPIAITSVSGDAFEKTGYISLTDLQYVVPGVQYDPTHGAAFQILW
ncbi:hypothetical protein ABTK13_20280, partial [Acinetobacter baumannii]